MPAATAFAVGSMATPTRTTIAICPQSLAVFAMASDVVGKRRELLTSLKTTGGAAGIRTAEK